MPHLQGFTSERTGKITAASENTILSTRAESTWLYHTSSKQNKSCRKIGWGSGFNDSRLSILEHFTKQNHQPHYIGQ